MYFFFWSLCCLFFFDLRILISPSCVVHAWIHLLKLSLDLHFDYISCRIDQLKCRYLILCTRRVHVIVFIINVHNQMIWKPNIIKDVVRNRNRKRNTLRSPGPTLSDTHIIYQPLILLCCAFQLNQYLQMTTY